ncbi:ABC transporter permease [Aquibaculum arenosum]|uniref:Transport permease protein n=1 Tax=Aquibaculum arenosum TaxID=3032591 RepID=A0ABT5YJS3_9PROT|nr:ABC transporter permease [Fodinicurvata sp. CAU 1616]MDF2095190.1 ABC transporter permease [Fodinicurvata sp. CAU 1616]
MSATRSFGDLGRSLTVQGRVIYALILREMQSRFGRSNIGYLWALVEPLLLVGVFTLGYVAIGRRSPPQGMEFLPFLATSIIAYLSMRNIASRMSSAIESNRSLLLFPQVTPFDLMLGRLLLETATFIAVFVVIIGGGVILGFASPPDRPFLLLVTVIYTALLGAGIGMLLGAITMNFPWVDHFMRPTWRLMLWISGIFFTLKQLPMSVQDILVWNPILHVIELMRAAYFAQVEPYRVSYGYVNWWILITTFMGLLCERMFRDRRKEK